jgi:hypothetical protein
MQEAIVGSTYCLVVSGPMPSAAIATVRDRFEDVRVSGSPARVVIECSIADQAALRGLLTQVWDVGSAVVLVVVLPSGTERNDHGHDQQ